MKAVPFKGHQSIKGDGQHANSPKIAQVLVYLNESYRENLTLSEAAKLVGYHPMHLSRKFKQEVGISFQAYIQRVRVGIASELLVSTQRSIKEIGHEVGFNQYESFSRVFKKVAGCTAGVYRLREWSVNGPVREKEASGPKRLNFVMKSSKSS